MNTLAVSFRVDRAPSKRTLWWLALATPATLGPLWCIAMSGLPAPWGSASGFVLLLLLIVTTATDLIDRKIYNWTTYSAAAWAIGINGLSHGWPAGHPKLGAVGLAPSLIGLACCFGVMLFAYMLARGGAGDVKLAAAIGALVGAEQGVLAIAVSYILAGVAIMAWSIWTQGPWNLIVAMGRFFGSMIFPVWIKSPTKTDRILLQKPVPLAGFFAAGTLLVLLDWI